MLLRQTDAALSKDAIQFGRIMWVYFPDRVPQGIQDAIEARGYTIEFAKKRQLWQLPRNGIVAIGRNGTAAIGTVVGPVALTDGSRKSQSAGCQACGRGGLLL